MLAEGFAIGSLGSLVAMYNAKQPSIKSAMRVLFFLFLFALCLTQVAKAQDTKKDEATKPEAAKPLTAELKDKVLELQLKDQQLQTQVQAIGNVSCQVSQTQQMSYKQLTDSLAAIQEQGKANAAALTQLLKDISKEMCGDEKACEVDLKAYTVTKKKEPPKAEEKK